MSLADQMEDDVEAVFLNPDDHATAHTYTPPLSGTPRSVTGIWDVQAPHVDQQNGLEVIHPATFVVAASQVFAREGIVTVDGVAWPVTEVGEPDPNMRTIHCERRTKVRTGANGRGFGK